VLTSNDLDWSGTVVYTEKQRIFPVWMTDVFPHPAGLQARTQMIRVVGLIGGKDDEQDAIPENSSLI
jgi:hypothetical protein